MKYLQVKSEIFNLEQEVKNKTYKSRKMTYHERLALIVMLAGKWSDVYLDLYDLRDKMPLDNGKDKLYDKLNSIRDTIMYININRR